MVAVAGGFGFQACGVGAGFGLGQGETGDQVTRGDAGQPFRFLGLRAEQNESLAADANVRAGDGAEGGRGLAEFKGDETLGFHVEVEAAILFRHGNAEQAEGLHLVDDVLRDGVFLADLGLDGHAGLGHEAAHLFNQRGAGFGIKGHAFRLPGVCFQAHFMPQRHACRRGP